MIQRLDLGPQTVVITPNAPEPVVLARVIASDPDGDPLTIRIEASAGAFRRTNTREVTLLSPNEIVEWRPDYSRATYEFTAVASDGEQEDSETDSVSIAPEVLGVWLGAAEIAPGSDRFFGFCMFVDRQDDLSQYYYVVRDRGSGTGSGGGGSANVASTYSFPTLTATFGSSTTSEAPRQIHATLAVDGSRFDAAFDLVNSATRILTLTRTTDGCSGESLDARIATL